MAEIDDLRDIPQTFDLTTDTPEQLKELWPEGLPREYFQGQLFGPIV